MIKLLEVFRIDITTESKDLPTHVASQIYMGGPGFIVNREQSFSWGDFIVVNTDGRVSGMTKENIGIMRENSKVLSGYYDRLTAVEFADGIEKDIGSYITALCKMSDGEHKRKIIKVVDSDNLKSIDFDLVRNVLEERKLILCVVYHEQLELRLCLDDTLPDEGVVWVDNSGSLHKVN